MIGPTTSSSQAGVIDSAVKKMCKNDIQQAKRAIKRMHVAENKLTQYGLTKAEIRHLTKLYRNAKGARDNAAQSYHNRNCEQYYGSIADRAPM